MSRIATGNQVVVAPTNNVYPALAAAAVIAQLLGLIVGLELDWNRLAERFEREVLDVYLPPGEGRPAR